MQGGKKIYQVFVSSTYTDLETERLKVIRDMLMSDFIRWEWNLFQLPARNNLHFANE